MGAILGNPRLKFWADDETPLSGGKLYTYIAGSSTPKAAYTDASCSTPHTHTNPIILDTDGETTVYLLGTYKLNLLDSSDVQQTGWPIDNVSAGEGLLGASAFYVDHNASDQGITGSGQTVAAFITSIGSNQATIVLPHNSGSATTTYSWDTDDTIPANITLYIENGAILAGVGGTETLTFAGGPNQIIAQQGQEIFDSTLTVAFSIAGTVYPQWWGATADGVTDSYDAFNAMCTALVDGCKVISEGDYYIDGSLQITANDIDVEVFGTLSWAHDSYQTAGYALDLSGDNITVTGGEWTTDMKIDYLTDSVQWGDTRLYVNNAGQWTTADYVACSHLWQDNGAVQTTKISAVGANYIDITNAIDTATPIAGGYPKWTDHAASSGLRAPKGVYILQAPPLATGSRFEPLINCSGNYSRLSNLDVHNTVGKTVFVDTGKGHRVESCHLYDTGIDIVSAGGVTSDGTESVWYACEFGNIYDYGKQVIVSAGRNGYHIFDSCIIRSNASDSQCYWWAGASGDPRNNNTLIFENCTFLSTKSWFMVDSSVAEYTWGKGAGDLIRVTNHSGEKQKKLFISNCQLGYFKDDIIGDAGVTWTDEGSNVWSLAYTTPPAIVWFDSTVRGIYNSSPSTSYHWHWTSDVLYVYSTSDPASAFSALEVELNALQNSSLAAGTSSGAIKEVEVRDSYLAGGIDFDVGSTDNIEKLTVVDCTIESETRLLINAVDCPKAYIDNVHMINRRDRRIDLEGNVTSATNSTLVYSSLDSEKDNWCKDASNNYFEVLILSGTGSGQVRTITDLTASGGSTTVTVSAVWTTNPDSTSIFQIFEEFGTPSTELDGFVTRDGWSFKNCVFENRGRFTKCGELATTGRNNFWLHTCQMIYEVVTTGTAQAGAVSTITLAAGASAQDQYYRGMRIRITGDGSGSGAWIGNERTCTSYNGTTKVLTVGANWSGTPDNQNTYEIYKGITFDNSDANDLPQAIDGSTNIDVRNLFAVRTANTAATLLYNFMNGVQGQRFLLLVEDDYTTIQFGYTASTGLRGNNGQNYKCSDGEIWEFTYTGTNWVGVLIKTVLETVTSTDACSTAGTSMIDSSGGAAAVTLANSTNYGQQKWVGMSNASNASTLTVATHATSNPEVFTFDNTADLLGLEWDGTQWTTIYNSGVAT